ncbi:MAG: hypothetical protein ACKOCT_17755 [Alphaproteobacteria bacterium]
MSGTAQRPARVGATIAVAAAISMLSGCAARRAAVPPRPALPAVKFVPACDPQAAVGLTAAGVDDLKQRDAIWRSHVTYLEGIISGTAR